MMYNDFTTLIEGGNQYPRVKSRNGEKLPFQFWFFSILLCLEVNEFFSQDVYRIGTLMELVRILALSFADDGKRVKVLTSFILLNYLSRNSCMYQ